MIFLSISITLKEPVKAGLQTSQNGTGSFSYLPGSMLRGAVMEILQKKNPEIPVEEVLRKVFFDPAYPSVGKTVLFPIPPVYFATKHEIRQAHGAAFPVSLRMPEDPDHMNPPKEGEQSAGRGCFGTVRDGRIQTFATRKTAKLHIATEQSRAGKTMFRYEAIAAGQQFLGTIRTEDENLAEKIASALEDTETFIGGSRSAGYGRSHIRVRETNKDTDRKRIYGLGEKRKKGLLTVYALSDVLLLDQNGVETGTPDPSYLEEQLHLTGVKLLGSNLTSRVTMGFNQTWKAGPEIRGAVAAGSIWYYASEGTPDPEAVRRLENEGIGLRRNEGYGSILINPDFTADIMEPLLKEKKSISVESGTLDSLSLSMLRKMQDRINDTRRDIAMRDEALRCEAQNAGLKKKFTSTQIMRLLNLLEPILQEEGNAAETSAMEKVNRYRSDLKTNTRNMYETAKIVLNRSHGAQWTLMEALEKLTNESVSFRDFAGVFALGESVNLTGDTLQPRSDFYNKAEYLYRVLYDLIRKNDLDRKEEAEK